MRTLTKKSLDELAQTMNVIPVAELEDYWGMWEDDCFWRCVSYLKTGNSSESSAASYAENYFSGVYGGYYQAVNYLSVNGASIGYTAMQGYASANSVPHGIVGFPNCALTAYGFEGSGNHVVVYKGYNANGGVDLYCPQTNTSFTMNFSDYVLYKNFQW